MTVVRPLRKLERDEGVLFAMGGVRMIWRGGEGFLLMVKALFIWLLAHYKL